LTAVSGKPWSAQTLRRLLLSARISGQREHHGEIVARAAQWEAINGRARTPARMQRTRAKLADPTRHTNHRSARRGTASPARRCSLFCSTACAPRSAEPRGDDALPDSAAAERRRPQGRRTAGRLNAGRGHNRPRRPPLGTTVGGSTIFGEAMGRPLLLVRPHQRPLCPDFGGDCAHLPFCEAWRCAVDLRRGLTGDLAHCPICGIAAVATYRLSPRRPRR
jgi:hypothetical protein